MYIIQMRRRGLLNLFRWKTVKKLMPDLETANKVARDRRIRHHIGPFQGIETRIRPVV